MLDAKRLRTDFEQVKNILQRRGGAYPELEQFGEWDIKRRDLIHESETLKARRNEVSQDVAQRKRNKEEADHLILEMREVGDQIKQLDDQLREVEEQLDHLLQTLPNLPHSSVPDGSDESENVTIRSWGEPAEFASPRAHWELAEEFDLLDFEAAAKVTGSRFVFYKGVGARLERALLSFMVDLHVDRHGYTEMMPPFMVNQSSMFGTGNFPKFKEDVFAVSGTDYYLIPTAEVPLTNYFRDSIMTAEQIPTKFCGWSTNFRSEAGSAGRDTRGLIRQHQFNKVELVQFVDPLLSYEHLEQLTADAEQVLQRLELPYRVVALCGGDLSFSSAKTYDLEVWLPQAGTYREISSCSNFEDFQARRANIRFKRDIHSKPELVHTLNGSGLAIGRTVAAILENGQREDGSIHIPEALQPYMGGMDTIK